MPLPKDMDKCMSKVKKEYPEGRSKKKMGKKEAHKQHVAMCLNTESVGLTLKDFLLIESDTESSIMIKQAVADLQRRGEEVSFENVAAELGVAPENVQRVVRVLSVDDPDLIRVFYER